MADSEDLITRRGALARLGALCAAPLTVTGCATVQRGNGPTLTDDDDDDASGANDDDDVALDCVLTPYQTEGPFWFDAGLVRQEISEGKPGIALAIGLRLVEATSCDPIRDAVVDLWHCDGSGWYSGYPNQGDNDDVDTSGETFCRGVQVTDQDGRVTFTTIFPGWYPGRAVHVHVKVVLNSTSLVTTQLYFLDPVIDQAHSNAPYIDRGPRDTLNSQDGVLGSNTATLVMQVFEKGDDLSAGGVIGIELS
jgi:protocatechuate 3,4-dioxygenase beta subunit